MKKWQYAVLGGVLVGCLVAIPYTRKGGKAEKPSSLVEITTANQLEGIIKDNGKVVVKFGATWCGPCQEYKPVYHKVAEEYKDKGIVFSQAVLDKIEKKETEEICSKYKVKYIPKTMMFKDGKEVFKKTGYMKDKELKSHIEEAFFQ